MTFSMAMTILGCATLTRGIMFAIDRIEGKR